MREANRTLEGAKQYLAEQRANGAPPGDLGWIEWLIGEVEATQPVVEATRLALAVYGADWPRETLHAYDQRPTATYLTVSV